MKKVFAKFLTLVLTIAMIVSVMPSAMAEGETVSLPTGNAAGRLTDGLTVKFGDGTDENMTATTLLTDGFHYTDREKNSYGVLPVDDTARTVLLDSTNNTIEFSWETAQSVKRLEMWIWRIGAVKDYKIQISDDGSVWNDYTTGTLDQSQPVPADASSPRSAFHIIQFNAVTTKYLRFVIVSFGENQTSAKIAEAIPRSSDNVNLLAPYTLSSTWLSSETIQSRLKWFSAYALSFRNSDAVDPHQLHLTGDKIPTNYRAYRNESHRIWPSADDAINSYVIRRNTNDENSFAWNTVVFPDSPQKINKVVVPIYTGSAQKIEILYSQKASESLPWSSDTAPYMACPDTTSGSEWKVAKTVTGNFTGNVTITIDDAPKAEFWMIKVPEASLDFAYSPVEMYSIHQSTSLFGEGASFATGIDESILTDNFYNVSGEANVKPTADASKFATFTSTESGIQWSWDTPMTTKRLDLWISQCGAVKDYEIQISDNGSNWTTHYEGAFDQSYTEDTLSYYYPVLYPEVSTKNIRFVIKSFKTGLSSAYISQAIIRDNDEVSLNADRTMPWLWEANPTSTSGHARSLFGSYYFNVSDSTRTDVSGKRLDYGVWPFNWNSNDYVSLKPAADGTLWYAISFRKSPVKINRVRITMTAGTATGAELMSSQTLHSGYDWDAAEWIRPDLNGGNYDSEIVLTNQSYSSANVVEFEVPESSEAVQWMVKLTGCSSNVRVSDVDFYMVHDEDLQPILGEGSIAIADDTVDAGEEATFSIFACNKNYPDAAVFFALYSGDTLIDAAKADMPISGIDTFEAKYTVPTNAEGELTLKAYLWDGKTLVPILNGPATK